MKASLAVISLIWVVLLGPASFAATCPESVPAPKYQVGDRFTWKYTTEKERVWEVTGIDGNLAQVKWSDGASRWDNDSAGTYFLDQDWVVRKGVTKKGDALLSPRMGPFAIIGKKVLSFPLYVGKTWDFNSEDRSLMQGGRTNFYTYLKVIGCEEVGTRAGKYLALKIEARLVPLGGSSWDITYWWYSPDAKNIVKKELGQFYEPYAGLHGRPFRPPDYELMEVELK